MNPSNRQNLIKPMYYFQRPESPKNTINHVQSSKNLTLNMSLGANQTPSSFFPQPRNKQEQPQSPTNEKKPSTSIDRC